MAEMVFWECEGSVRGNCGIKHRTLQAAERCCRLDARGCKAQGGYSDRKPVEVTRYYLKAK